jgi:hypothetical protein
LTFVARQAVVCEHVPIRPCTRQPLSSIQEGSALYTNHKQWTRWWWILAAIVTLLLFLDQYFFQQSGGRVQSELQALFELIESNEAAQQHVSAMHRQFFVKQQQHIHDMKLEINIPMQIAYKIVQADIDYAYI